MPRSSSTNAGPQNKIVRVDLSARQNIAGVPLTSNTPKTTKWPTKRVGCVGVLFVMLLLLALWFPSTYDAPRVYKHPTRWGQTSTDVSQSTLPVRNPQSLPVVIHVISEVRLPNPENISNVDNYTCMLKNDAFLDFKRPITIKNSMIIPLSHILFQNEYKNKSLGLRGMELCIFLKDPYIRISILEYLKDESEEESL